MVSCLEIGGSTRAAFLGRQGRCHCQRDAAYRWAQRDAANLGRDGAIAVRHFDIAQSRLAVTQIIAMTPILWTRCTAILWQGSKDAQNRTRAEEDTSTMYVRFTRLRGMHRRGMSFSCSAPPLLAVTLRQRLCPRLTEGRDVQSVAV